MRSATFALAALAVVAPVLAQGANYPTCALVCLAQTSRGTCSGSGGVQCSCENEEAVAETLACVMEECNEADQLRTGQLSAQLCSAAGFELVLPVSETTTSTASSSSTSTVAASSVSTSTTVEATNTVTDTEDTPTPTVRVAGTVPDNSTVVEYTGDAAKMGMSFLAVAAFAAAVL